MAERATLEPEHIGKGGHHDWEDYLSRSLHPPSLKTPTTSQSSPPHHLPLYRVKWYNRPDFFVASTLPFKKNLTLSPMIVLFQCSDAGGVGKQQGRGGTQSYAGHVHKHTRPRMTYACHPHSSSQAGTLNSLYSALQRHQEATQALKQVLECILLFYK